MKILTSGSIFLFSLFILTGCGTSKYVNTSYNYDQIEEASIALFPIVHVNNPAFIDTLFEESFNELFIAYDFVSPTTIREVSQSREEYKSLIKKISSTTSDIQNLHTYLTTQELTYLGEMISNSRFIFIPAQFSLKDATGSVIGKTTFHLYDISSGTLILRDETSFNVMPDGTLRSGGLISAMSIGTYSDPATSAIAKYCIELLAIHGRESLTTNFLTKVNKTRN